MTENKRYFSIDYDEEYYIFDSTKISKEEVLEQAEYSYDVFADSLTSSEIVELLNENEELKQLIKKVLETTPMKHKLAIELKNSVRDLYG